MDARYGAIVLCGGASTRMGQDKAWLPWGPDATLLQHVVRILQRVVPTDNIAVVGGHDQNLPQLPLGVSIIGDSTKTAGSGPLAGLMAGLVGCQATTKIEAVFAVGCDAPLVAPALVERLFALLANDVDAVVPADHERMYPLAAVYRPSCYKLLLDAYFAGERSLYRVLGSGRFTVRNVAVDALRDVDPALDSLVNCNTQEQYQWALRRSGLPA
jgi:molybdopterin-guanine dinucleotide biosynthesis protein A